MGKKGWEPEKFCQELGARLDATWSAAQDRGVLAAALKQCAEAAERECRGRRMACAAGCPHCCVLNVAILLPEAMAIAGWLLERLPQPRLAELRKLLEVHRSWTRWMDDEERLIKHATCPMLDAAGSCLIHPVRPLACRGVSSLDSESCREVLAPVVTDEPRLVPTDLLRRAAYDEAFAELAKLLSRHSLDKRSIELGTGVLAFLEHPEYGELFLAGGSVPDSLWR